MKKVLSIANEKIEEIIGYTGLFLIGLISLGAEAINQTITSRRYANEEPNRV